MLPVIVISTSVFGYRCGIMLATMICRHQAGSNGVEIEIYHHSPMLPLSNTTAPLAVVVVSQYTTGNGIVAVVKHLIYTAVKRHCGG